MILSFLPPQGVSFSNYLSPFHNRTFGGNFSRGKKTFGLFDLSINIKNLIV